MYALPKKKKKITFSAGPSKNVGKSPKNDGRTSSLGFFSGFCNTSYIGESGKILTKRCESQPLVKVIDSFNRVLEKPNYQGL